MNKHSHNVLNQRVFFQYFGTEAEPLELENNDKQEL